MRDGTYEWDDAKATANYAKHGVTFEAARAAFKDPFALEWSDEDAEYGEDRYVAVGMVGSRLVYVAYTLRGDRMRIISARLAGPQERRRYHEEDD